MLRVFDTWVYDWEMKELEKYRRIREIAKSPELQDEVIHQRIDEEAEKLVSERRSPGEIKQGMADFFRRLQVVVSEDPVSEEACVRVRPRGFSKELGMDYKRMTDAFKRAHRRMVRNYQLSHNTLGYLSAIFGPEYTRQANEEIRRGFIKPEE